MAVNTNPTFGASDDDGGDYDFLPAPVETFEEWYAKDPSVQAALAKTPKMFHDDIKAKLKADYNAQAAAKNASNVADAVPGVLEWSEISPEDLTPYNNNLRYSLAGAQESLYDPSQVERDMTGRGILMGSGDYFADIMQGDGRDAQSEAYYQDKLGNARMQARAQREAALQNLDERGMNSSGAGILAELRGASDISRDAHSAALGANAMAQGRKDLAASQHADIGRGVQNADDQWSQWYTGEMSGYGKDKAKIAEAEASTNYGRETSVVDKNIGMQNDAVYRNKALPLTGFDLATGASRDVRGELHRGEDTARGDIAKSEAEPNAWDYAGEVLDRGAKIYQVGWGDDDED